MSRTAVLISLCLFTLTGLFAQCPEGSVTSQKNLVVNGDFSQGNVGFYSEYRFSRVGTHRQMLDAGLYAIVTNPNFVHSHFAECTDHTNGHGLMMVANGANIDNQIVWRQEIEVKENTTYYFSAWLANMVSGMSPAKSQFSINGQLLGDPLLATDETCNWKQFFTTWESGDATKAVIEIVNKNLDYLGNDFALDDISFYECVSPNFEDQLKSARVGQIIELRKIFFDSGKDDLKDESFEQLNKLVAYLMNNPSVEIEIAGHTDNLGSKESNQSLSEKRAEAVADYLKSKGISKNRYKAIGYGESQPIDSNITYEGRQINRRVEFKIIKM